MDDMTKLNNVRTNEELVTEKTISKEEVVTMTTVTDEHVKNFESMMEEVQSQSISDDNTILFNLDKGMELLNRNNVSYIWGDIANKVVVRELAKEAQPLIGSPFVGLLDTEMLNAYREEIESMEGAERTLVDFIIEGTELYESERTVLIGNARINHNISSKLISYMEKEYEVDLCADGLAEAMIVAHELGHIKQKNLYPMEQIALWEKRQNSIMFGAMMETGMQESAIDVRHMLELEKEADDYAMTVLYKLGLINKPRIREINKEEIDMAFDKYDTMAEEIGDRVAETNTLIGYTDMYSDIVTYYYGGNKEQFTKDVIEGDAQNIDTLIESYESEQAQQLEEESTMTDSKAISLEEAKNNAIEKAVDMLMEKLDTTGLRYVDNIINGTINLINCSKDIKEVDAEIRALGEEIAVEVESLDDANYTESIQFKRKEIKNISERGDAIYDNRPEVKAFIEKITKTQSKEMETMTKSIKEMNGKELKEEAKRLGMKGYSKLSVEGLRKEIKIEISKQAKAEKLAIEKAESEKLAKAIKEEESVMEQMEIISGELTLDDVPESEEIVIEKTSTEGISSKKVNKIKEISKSKLSDDRKAELTKLAKKANTVLELEAISVEETVQAVSEDGELVEGDKNGKVELVELEEQKKAVLESLDKIHMLDERNKVVAVKKINEAETTAQIAKAVELAKRVAQENIKAQKKNNTKEENNMKEIKLEATLILYVLDSEGNLTKTSKAISYNKGELKQVMRENYSKGKEAVEKAGKKLQSIVAVDKESGKELFKHTVIEVEKAEEPEVEEILKQAKQDKEEEIKDMEEEKKERNSTFLERIKQMCDKAGVKNPEFVANMKDYVASLVNATVVEDKEKADRRLTDMIGNATMAELYDKMLVLTSEAHEAGNRKLVAVYEKMEEKYVAMVYGDGTAEDVKKANGVFKTIMKVFKAIVKLLGDVAFKLITLVLDILFKALALLMTTVVLVMDAVIKVIEDMKEVIGKRLREVKTA